MPGDAPTKHLSVDRLMSFVILRNGSLLSGRRSFDGASRAVGKATRSDESLGCPCARSLG
jgi:hypothetical protein